MSAQNSARTAPNDQRGHMRFIGGTVYCPRAEKRVKVEGLRYGAEFVCPGCGVRIPETRHHAKATSSRG